MIVVQTKREITENVRLTPPMFWKSPSEHYKEYIGLLDDKTVVSVLFLGDYVSIKNGEPKSFTTELTSAHKLFNLSNEAEFFAAFDEAYEAMRLTPEIRETAGEYHEPEEKEQPIPCENKVD